MSRCSNVTEWSHYTGHLAAAKATDKALPHAPSYHELSLEVIRCLSSDKPGSRPSSRSVADLPPGTASKVSPSTKTYGQQYGTEVDAQLHNSSAGAAHGGSKSSITHNGKTGAVLDAPQNSQPSPIIPYKRQTTFRFEDVKEEFTDSLSTQKSEVLSEATFTKRIMQQMSFTGNHEEGSRLFLEV